MLAHTLFVISNIPYRVVESRTLAFVQRMLNEQGEIKYDYTQGNPPGSPYHDAKTLEVAADTPKCAIRMTETTFSKWQAKPDSFYRDGTPGKNDDPPMRFVRVFTISLKRVRNIEVGNLSDAWTRSGVEFDPTFTVGVSPCLVALTCCMRGVD